MNMTSISPRIYNSDSQMNHVSARNELIPSSKLRLLLAHNPPRIRIFSVTSFFTNISSLYRNSFMQPGKKTGEHHEMGRG